MARKGITDKIWETLRQLLPAPKGRHGLNDRLFLESVLLDCSK